MSDLSGQKLGKTILVAASRLYACPELAETSDCPTTMVEGVILLAASNACNKSWRNRPSYKLIMSAAHYCSLELNESESSEWVKGGLDSWHELISKLGRDGACQNVDATMKEADRASANSNPF